MVSSALPDDHLLQAACPATVNSASSLSLIIDNDRPALQVNAAEKMLNLLHGSESYPACDIIPFDHLLAMSDEQLGVCHCILLVDLGGRHLQDIDEIGLICYQKALTACKSLLWVQTHQKPPVTPPHWAMVEGLCRVVRNEHPFVRIVMLTLESGFDAFPADTIAEKTLRVLEAVSRATDAYATDVEGESWNSQAICAFHVCVKPSTWTNMCMQRHKDPSKLENSARVFL